MTDNVCVFFACANPDNMRIRVVINGFSDIRVREFSGAIKDCPGRILDQLGLRMEGTREYVISFICDYINWISEKYIDMEIFIEKQDLDALSIFQEMIEKYNCKWGDGKTKTLNLVRLSPAEYKSDAEENAEMIMHKILNFLNYHDDFKKINYTLFN